MPEGTIDSHRGQIDARNSSSVKVSQAKDHISSDFTGYVQDYPT